MSGAGEPPIPKHLFALKWKDRSGKVKVYNLRETFADKWKDVGRVFGIEEGQLKSFASNNRSDPEKCFDDVLSQWRRNRSVPAEAYPVTWRGLIQALRDLGSVAREVAELETALKSRVEDIDTVTIASIQLGNGHQRSHHCSPISLCYAAVPIAVVLLAIIIARLVLPWYFLGSHGKIGATVTTTYVTSAPNNDLVEAVPKTERWLRGYQTICQHTVHEESPISSTDENEKPLSLTHKPKMTQLLSFPADGSKLNIPQEIGTDYDDFGIFLLNDDSGSTVANIKSVQRGDPEQINKMILKRWLEGRGRSPVTWETLIKVLRLIRKNVLANDIEKSMT